MSDGPTFGVEAYDSHFRVAFGSSEYWTTQENSSLADEDAVELFKQQRAAFINSRNGNDKSAKSSVWTWPTPWNPEGS